MSRDSIVYQRRQRGPGALWVRLLVPLALLVGSPAPGLAQDEPPPTLPIVAKSLDYHGIRVWQSSQISGLLQSQSGTFALRTRRRGVGFDYFVIVEHGEEGGAGTTEYRLNNLRVAKLVDGEEIELATPEARQEATDFVMDRVYTTLLPFLLGDAGVVTEDLGLETWEERELHRVKATYPEGGGLSCASDYLFWFDPETGRLEQFAYSFDGGLRFRRLMHHERNHGVVLANQESFGASGEELTVETITAEFVSQSMEKLEPVLFEPVRVRLLR